MGNNASTGMYAQIEAATYTGGQMMRGTVYCDLKEPVQVALLYLKVVGKRECARLRAGDAPGVTA